MSEAFLKCSENDDILPQKPNNNVRENMHYSFERNINNDKKQQQQQQIDACEQLWSNNNLSVI